MICKNGFLLLIMAYSLPTALLAQSKGGLGDIDLSNTFNTQYTCIGIPIRDSVYIYDPSSSKSPINWSHINRLAIPEGTVAMDGNIGKSIFMTKETIIFEEYGRYDTLRFHAGLPSIDPRLWIRTPHSTEVDSYFLSGEKNVCYYRDPTVHDALLGDKIIAPSELDFSLPQGTVTAFIYDFKYLAVVLQEQIDFYGFDSAQKKWKKAKGIPSLRFASLNQDK